MSPGDALKAEGIEQIEKREGYHAFVGRVLAVMHDIIAHGVEEFTVARIRWEFNKRKLEDAPHPNAWGPAMKRAVSSGLIIRTDRTVKSTYPATAHSRMVPVYRRKKVIQ